VFTDFEILSRPATGGTPSLITNNTTNEFEPSPSAVRNQIAFRRYDGNDQEIFTMTMNTPGARNVSSNNSDDSWPDYRPDGNQIVYSSWDGNDWEIVIATRFFFGFFEIWSPAQLTNNNSPDLTPGYSPNGQQIAYSGYDGNDQEIFTIPATGGTRSQVTDSPTNEVYASWQPRP
jgi:Tol biopolymer transport system component